MVVCIKSTDSKVHLYMLQALALGKNYSVMQFHLHTAHQLHAGALFGLQLVSWYGDDMLP